MFDFLLLGRSISVFSPRLSRALSPDVIGYRTHQKRNAGFDVNFEKSQTTSLSPGKDKSPEGAIYIIIELNEYSIGKEAVFALAPDTEEWWSVLTFLSNYGSRSLTHAFPAASTFGPNVEKLAGIAVEKRLSLP